MNYAKIFNQSPLTDYVALESFISENKNIFGVDNLENIKVLESNGFKILDLIDSELDKVEILLITVLEK
jgi:hypothetical protein